MLEFNIQTKLSITLQQNNIHDHVFNDMQSQSAINILIDDSEKDSD